MREKHRCFFFRIDDDPLMIPSLIFAGRLFSRTNGFHCQETHLADQETQVLNVLIAMFLKYLSPVSYILTGTLAMLFIIWRCSDALGWDFWIIQVNELAVHVTFDFNLVTCGVRGGYVPISRVNTRKQQFRPWKATWEIPGERCLQRYLK